jgi:hypothetical protein
MADAAARCPGQAVTWDGRDHVDSSGKIHNPAEQLAEVSKQYLQHLEQHGVDIPTNVEGAQQTAA